MERLFWPIVFTSSLNFILAIIAVFLLKTNPLHLVGAGLIEVIVISLAVMKYTGRLDLYYLVLIPFLLITAVITVLVYKEWLPESLNKYPKKEYEF